MPIDYQYIPDIILINNKQHGVWKEILTDTDLTCTHFYPIFILLRNAPEFTMLQMRCKN